MERILLQLISVLFPLKRVLRPERCRFPALILMLLFPLNTAAQGYFMESVGAEMEYLRTNVKDGSFHWGHVITVTDVEHIGATHKYTTESVFTKKNGKPMYRSNVVEITYVDTLTHSINTDVGLAAISYASAISGLKTTGTSLLSPFPADIEPGDVLEPIVTAVKVGPLTYTATITDRRVVRRETITVPAGTFDCMVVSEHKVESGPGHNRDVTNLTWYAKGVGYVRHDTHNNKKDVPETTEVLISYSKK